MRINAISAAWIGAAMLAMAPETLAQTTPADSSPSEDTPWYEQKIIPPPLSATIGFQTDYRFRGISLTERDPHVFGSLDFEYEIAPFATVYAGILGENANVFEADAEIDAYGGFKGKIFDPLSYNVMFIGYQYAGDHELNFFEAIPSLTYDFGFLSLTGGAAFSPDYFGGSGFGAWPYGDVSIPIPLDFVKPYKLAAVGHIGYQFVEDNTKFGAPDYLEWEAGLTAGVFGFNLALKYIDTNMSKSDCFGENWCKPTVLFSISKTF